MCIRDSPYAKEYGGAGLGYVEYALAGFELNKVDASVGISYSVHISLGTGPIYNFGNEEQKKKYLPKLCSGEYIAAFGLTEPCLLYTSRIDWEDITPISTFLEYALLKNIESKIDELDAVILSDYDKGVLTPMVAKEIVRMCRERGKIVTVDPKPKNAVNYTGATSITPNRKEALECLGLKRSDDMEAVGKELKAKLQLDNLLLTRSEEVMSLFLDNDEVITIPTFAKEVYDVTGAGDTVISVFTLAGASGVSWHEAAKIANTAAGVVVGKMGTSTVTKDEVLEFYNRIYERWE